MIRASLTAYFNDVTRMGPMPQPVAAGCSGSRGEGPWIAVYLRTGDGGPGSGRPGTLIVEARFETYACPIGRACGSFLTQWVEGKTIEMTRRIEAVDLALILGGLPLGKEHCATLAVEALRKALDSLAGAAG